jgi:hypothetical protein
MKQATLSGLLAAGLTVCCAVGTTSADTIARWTFETSAPSTSGPIAPEEGAGSATSVHATPGTFSSPSGNGSAQSYNSNSWAVGDYYQFVVSTTGKTGILFSWDQTRSSSGPGQPNPSANNFQLQYSTDGSIFSIATDYLVPSVTWNNSTPDLSTQYFQDLSAVSALDNQPNVYFRLAAILGPQSANGQSRVDNVRVSTIPEPGAFALGMLGMIGLAVLRRRLG